MSLPPLTADNSEVDARLTEAAETNAFLQSLTALINAHLAAIAEKSAIIESLTSELALNEIEIAQLQSSLAQLQAQIANLNAQIAALTNPPPPPPPPTTEPQPSDYAGWSYEVVMGLDPNGPNTIHVQTVLRNPNGEASAYATGDNGDTDVIIHTYTSGGTLRVTSNGLVGRTIGEGWIGSTVQLSAYSV
jgi:hypothetical protein